MKKILQLLFLSLFSSSAFAQTTILNGGFENWTGTGANIIPQYWNSNTDGNALASDGGQTCYQYTPGHSGTYCAEVKSGSFLGNVINGALTTGYVDAPDFTKAHGYIWSEGAPYNSTFAMQFVGIPDSLVFWYKYTPSGTDSASVQARLHVGNCYAPEAPSGGNHADSSSNIIARALWTSPPSSEGSWTRISVPFVYVDGNTPQYIFITCTSSASNTGGTSGSTLYLDDMEAIYNPKINTGTVSTGPYYVSSTTGANVSVPFTLINTFNSGNVVTAQLSDASGSFSSPVSIGSSTTTTSGAIAATIPANTASGTGYRIRVVSSNPALTATDNGANISVILVNTSVAPSLVQDIQVNTSGVALTVTETPAATSRQWQYSATSGGPYQAFTLNQTGTTYTPNFGAPGSWYVVCVSTYPGSLNVNSNEVQINADSNSIAPIAVQSIIAGRNGNVLTVTEVPPASFRVWKYSAISGGPYQPFTLNQTGSTYTPNFPIAGTYYVVCASSFFFGALTLTSNEVQINSVATSVAPGSVQTVVANGNGSTLTVTQTPAAASQQWLYSTTSGGPYQAFVTNQTGLSYTPNFATAGSYYVVCLSAYTGGLNDTSNEVQINVVSNSIAPSSSQSLLTNVNGTTLTVTESPTGTSRQWEYGTTSGGPYQDFGSPQTGTSYTPNFSTTGTYYVVCESVIEGITATSNEVLISVGNATITTGTVTGSPFFFSPSAPDANVSVPFTTSGTFNNGNIFTAQLSDPTGAFGSPTAIGTYAGTTSGTVNTVIAHTTPAGTAYRIRVVSASPVVLGSDNGANLIVDQFHNSIAPTTTQTILYDANGNALTVTASQTSTQQWKFSTTNGSGYAPFIPAQTGAAYTPNFAVPDTYYVVCVSTNQYNDSVTSNPVEVIVNNGTGISTSTITGSPFLVSPHATAPVNVNFTSTAVFSSGNIFTAQLSDAVGSFSSPVNIGTLTGTTIGAIASIIPDVSVSGTQYRIRVISSNPAITGSDNGSDLTISQFSNSIAPDTAQTILFNTNGAALTVSPSQSGTQQWKYSTTQGSGYASFLPAQTGNTYTPNFAAPGTYYVVCTSINQWSDSVTSNEVGIIVTNGSVINTLPVSGSPYYISDSSHNQVSVSFTSDAVFSSGNVFTAQLSDQNGSFATPVNTGSLTSVSIGAISSAVPNNSVGGTHYRIRVVSSSPAITGTDNGTDLVIIPFEVSIAPTDTQTLRPGQEGTPLIASSTHPVSAYAWQYTEVSGIGYQGFVPAQAGDTLVPDFSSLATYYVICNVTNLQHATLRSQEVVIIVTNSSGITGVAQSFIKAYWDNNDFIADLTSAHLTAPVLELVDVDGRVVVQQKISPLSVNRIATALPEGFYIFRITDGANSYTGKTGKK